ncbi:MAG: hypothetical protein R3E87_22085 [Burkholderiaceae bacterium]
MIENAKGSVASISSVFDTGSATREHLLTQVEFIRSRNVLERVIDELDLTANPVLNPGRPPKDLLKRGRELLPVLDSLLPPASDAAPDPGEVRRQVLETLSRQVQVEPVRLSQLIQVSVESTDPVLAAEIATQWRARMSRPSWTRASP